MNCSAVQLITVPIRDRLAEEFGREWEGGKGTGSNGESVQVLRWCLAQGLTRNMPSVIFGCMSEYERGKKTSLFLAPLTPYSTGNPRNPLAGPFTSFQLCAFGNCSNLQWSRRPPKGVARIARACDCVIGRPHCQCWCCSCLAQLELFGGEPGTTWL